MSLPREAKSPSPQTTLVILLGASTWPLSPEFQSSEAFAKAALRLKAYLLNPQLFGLPEENLLDLFDSEKSADELDEQIGQYLEQRLATMKEAGNEARDLMVYFIGHGGFVGHDADYYLATRRTRMSNPRVSGIHILALADTLIEKARYLRRIIILDCCFAAAAFSAFQSGPDEVAVQKTITAFLVNSKSVGFPARGTSLLCSSNQKSPSLLLPDNSSTLFTKAFLDALEQGAPSRPSHLSLRDVKDLAADQLYEIQNAPKPVVLSPDQSEGDIADIPFFPNPKSGQMDEAEEETHVLHFQDEPVSRLSRAQRQPEPFSPFPNQKRKRTGLIIALIILVLMLASGSIFTAAYFSKKGQVSLATPTLTPPTPSIDAATPSPSPAQLYDAVTSRPPFYSSNLIQQDTIANWDEFTSTDGLASCRFANGTYEATVQQIGLVVPCLEQSFSLTDFAFQAHMTILSGANGDGGGLVFRDTSNTIVYRFRVGLDGSYDVT